MVESGVLSDLSTIKTRQNSEIMSQQDRHHQLEEAKNFIMSTLTTSLGDSNDNVENGGEDSDAANVSKIIKPMIQDFPKKSVFDLISAMQANYLQRGKEIERLHQQIDYERKIFIGVILLIVVAFFCTIYFIN